MFCNLMALTQSGNFWLEALIFVLFRSSERKNMLFVNEVWKVVLVFRYFCDVCPDLKLERDHNKRFNANKISS